MGKQSVKLIVDKLWKTSFLAVALGLRAIRQCSWVEEIGQNFTIRVLARDTPVEHSVEFRAFHKWLEQPSRSPREIMARARVREILGDHTLRLSTRSFVKNQIG